MLFAIHAVLTGIAMVLMHALGVHLGFGFSAGLFDYVLNYSLATRPLLLLPVGVGYFALYYFLFRFCILRFDLKTLGREAEGAVAAPVDSRHGSAPALDWIRALGGAGNLRAVEACTTRLRLVRERHESHRRAGAVGARLSRRVAPGRRRRAGGGRAHRRSARLGNSRARLRMTARTAPT